MTITRREFEEMRREVARLQREIALRPLFGGGGGQATTWTIDIVGGNTLATGQAGIKYSSSLIASVPSAYDPNVSSSFIDGIGRGTLRANGVAVSGFVLVVNDTVGALARALVLNDRIATMVVTAIPVSGGGGATVDAWVPIFL